MLSRATRACNLVRHLAPGLVAADGTLPSGSRMYNESRQESDWVSTILWLEHLILEHGVRAVTARRQFQECGEQGLVSRVTASLMSQTACQCHALRVLEAADGNPLVRAISLYHEDFLIPTKASSHIMPERIV